VWEVHSQQPGSGQQQPPQSCLGWGGTTVASSQHPVPCASWLPPGHRLLASHETAGLGLGEAGHCLPLAVPSLVLVCPCLVGWQQPSHSSCVASPQQPGSGQQLPMAVLGGVPATWLPPRCACQGEASSGCQGGLCPRAASTICLPPPQWLKVVTEL